MPRPPRPLTPPKAHRRSPMSRIGRAERLWIEVDHEALIAGCGVLPALGRMRQRIEPQHCAWSGVGHRGRKRSFGLDVDALRGHE